MIPELSRVCRQWSPSHEGLMRVESTDQPPGLIRPLALFSPACRLYNPTRLNPIYVPLVLAQALALTLVRQSSIVVVCIRVAGNLDQGRVPAGPLAPAVDVTGASVHFP